MPSFLLARPKLITSYNDRYYEEYHNDIDKQRVSYNLVKDGKDIQIDSEDPVYENYVDRIKMTISWT